MKDEFVKAMKIAFIIFNGMTALDFIGVYDPVTRLRSMGFLPDMTWDICSLTKEVRDNNSLCFKPTMIGKSLESYDMTIVPGGSSARELAKDLKFVTWLKSAAKCKFKVSICSGALLLGAAGFLKEKRATTHRSAFQELSQYCSEVVDKKVIEDGDVMTARGVSSSIDMGLYICEKLAGYKAKEEIRRQIDFDQVGERRDEGEFI